MSFCPEKLKTLIYHAKTKKCSCCNGENALFVSSIFGFAQKLEILICLAHDSKKIYRYICICIDRLLYKKMCVHHAGIRFIYIFPPSSNCMLLHMFYINVVHIYIVEPYTHKHIFRFAPSRNCIYNMFTSLPHNETKFTHKFYWPHVGNLCTLIEGCFTMKIYIDIKIFIYPYNCFLYNVAYIIFLLFAYS